MWSAKRKVYVTGSPMAEVLRNNLKEIENSNIHEKLGLDFVTCTPGIRQASDSVDDQKRVVTPEKARELGSDYIVVGRSITRAQNPVETYQLINKQFLGL